MSAVASPESLLETIARPMGDAACGVDPRYSDSFTEVKEEIEKLSGTDFARVYAQAAQILACESKDLRVLGYLALAALYEHGLGALARVIEAYRYVLETWWEECHPQREAARAAALDWLDNPRFLAFLDRAIDRHDADAVAALQAAINNWQATVAARMPDRPLPWRSFAEQLAKSAPAAPPPAAPAGPLVQSPTRNAADGSDTAKAPPVVTAAGSVASDQELQTATRAVLAYLKQQGDWLRMAAFARALRWGGLVLPPNDGGRTRIAPPRPAALAEVETARAQGNWQDALLACEAAFMEPGGQFCLRLQHWAHDCAQRLNNTQLATYLANAVRDLLERVPELANLRYDNDQPFCDYECRDWLEALLAPPQAAPSLPVPEIVEIPEQEAAELAKAQGLASGLALLDACAVHSERQRAQLELARARVCLANNRGDLALPLLQALDAKLEQAAVDRWEPALALQVWQALRQALSAAGKRSGLGEAELKAAQAAIKAKICRTDLTAAAVLFGHQE